MAFFYTDRISDFSSDDTLLIDVDPGIDRKHDLMLFLERELKPPYFGRNWSALIDVLAGSMWHTHRNLALYHRDLPLSSNEAELATYLDVLNSAGRSHDERQEGDKFTVGFHPDLR